MSMHRRMSLDELYEMTRVAKTEASRQYYQGRIETLEQARQIRKNNNEEFQKYLNESMEAYK